MQFIAGLMIGLGLSLICGVLWTGLLWSSFRDKLSDERLKNRAAECLIADRIHG